MKDLGFYQTIAQERVQRDGERDRMMSAMEQMWRGEGSLPRQVADLKWIHKVLIPVNQVNEQEEPMP